MLYLHPDSDAQLATDRVCCRLPRRSHRGERRARHPRRMHCRRRRCQTRRSRDPRPKRRQSSEERTVDAGSHLDMAREKGKQGAFSVYSRIRSVPLARLNRRLRLSDCHSTFCVLAPQVDRRRRPRVPSESIIRKLGTIQLRIFRGKVGTAAKAVGDDGYRTGIEAVQDMRFEETSAKVKGGEVSQQAGSASFSPLAGTHRDASSFQV